MRSRRLRCTIGNAAVVSLCATAALAEPEAAAKRVCADMAVRGQREQAQGRLLEARLSFTGCAATSCPEIIRTDCAAWRADVEAELPSLVVSVRDERGERVLATMTLDGDRAPEGRPLPVNPGEHRLEAIAGDGRRASRAVLVRAGERDREVRLQLPALAPPPPQVQGRGATWGSWALAGVSAGAALSFAYFGLNGRAEARDLRARCAPSCDPDDVAHARRELVVADVSLGVSVLAAAGAVLLRLRARSSEPAPTAFRVRWDADGRRITCTLRFR